MLTGKPRSMRLLNKRIVYDLIKRKNATTRPEICIATDLKPPTVKSVIEDLLDDGLIKCIGKGESAPKGGPCPDVYSVNDNRWYFVGFDVNMSEITAVVVNLSGDIVAEEYMPFNHQNGEQLEDALCTITKSLLSAACIQMDLVSEISISFAALVDANQKKVSAAAGDKMYAFDINQFREVLGCSDKIKISVENDINAIIMGMLYLSEELKNEKHIICIGVRGGVGMSVVIDGKVYRGRDGQVGRVSEFPNAMGESRMIEHINKMIAGNMFSTIDKPIENRKALHDAFMDNNEIKAAVYDCYKQLGLFIAECILMLNPSAVILTGHILNMDAGLYKAAVDSCEQHLQDTFANIKGMRSRPIYLHAKMDRFSVAHYAALQVMDEFYNLLYM